MNTQFENMKYWSIREWDRYLAQFGHRVVDAKPFKNKWMMTVSRSIGDKMGPIPLADIKVILPLV